MNSLSAEHRDDYIDALQDDILVAKLSKSQIKEAARTDNCIDALPDDILVAILSKLQFKEAVRTSVLSRRWESVWKFLSCLDFDATENMKRIYFISDIEAGRRKYINWVNQMLEYSCMESSTVEELRIALNLGENHANEIDKWICFAMAKRVKCLKLDFSTLCEYSSSLYTFQDSLLQLPCIISGFGSLTVLSLKGVDVSGDTVACILSNSPLLETFTLQKARSLLSLVVKGPSVLKLKHLKIVDCLKLTTLEISAENLVSFKYRGTPIDISYRNLPLLSEFLIGGSYAAHWIYELDQLSYYLSQLHTLTLNLCYVRKGFYSFPAKFPEFINLKHLELRFLDFDDSCLAFIVFLLEATPYLCSLMVKAQVPTLAVGSCYNYHLIPSKSDCVIGNLWSYQRVERRAHKYLKVIELVGWTVKETDVKLATYLLEIAVSLDKIIIDPCFNNYKKKRTFGESLPTEGRKEVVREHARRQLGSKLPLGAKLLTR